MDAQTLKQHYESELEARSRPGGGDQRHGRRMFRAMLKASQALSACTVGDPESTWVWSDLHLGHDNIIRYTNRPYTDAAAMDSALYENWATTVGSGDELVFVGDLAMRNAVGPHTWQRIRDGRGARKHLVVGNHDLTGSGQLRVDGFDTVGAVMFVDGDPPLVFTHIPFDGRAGGLRQRPRPHPQRDAERHAAHQRLGGATGLPARGAAATENVGTASGRGTLSRRPNNPGTYQVDRVLSLANRLLADYPEVSTRGRARTRKEQRVVGDGLVPSRCLGRWHVRRGRPQRTRRVRGRPYEFVM